MNRLIFFVLFFGLLALSACEEGEETSVDKISGYFNVEESSATYGEQTYKVQVRKDLYIPDIIAIYNFFGLGSYVRVVGSIEDNVIVLDSQIVDGFQIVGEGDISDDYNTIDFLFTVEEVSGKSTQKSAEVVEAFFTRTDD